METDIYVKGTFTLKVPATPPVPFVLRIVAWDGEALKRNGTTLTPDAPQYAATAYRYNSFGPGDTLEATSATGAVLRLAQDLGGGQLHPSLIGATPDAITGFFRHSYADMAGNSVQINGVNSAVRRAGLLIAPTTPGGVNLTCLRLYGTGDPTQYRLRAKTVGGQAVIREYAYQGQYAVEGDMNGHVWVVGGSLIAQPGFPVIVWLEKLDGSAGISAYAASMDTDGGPAYLDQNAWAANFGAAQPYLSTDARSFDAPDNLNPFTDAEKSNYTFAVDAGSGLSVPTLYASGGTASRPANWPINVPRWNTDTSRYELRQPNGTWVGITTAP